MCGGSLDFMRRGEDWGSAPTIQLNATPSRQPMPSPPSSPNYTPDSLPTTILPIYPGLGQARNMLDCIVGGLVQDSLQSVHYENIRQRRRKIIPCSRPMIYIVSRASTSVRPTPNHSEYDLVIGSSSSWPQAYVRYALQECRNASNTASIRAFSGPRNVNATGYKHFYTRVSWRLTSHFSINIRLYRGRKVRGAELCLPSIERPAIY